MRNFITPSGLAKPDSLHNETQVTSVILPAGVLRFNLYCARYFLLCNCNLTTHPKPARTLSADWTQLLADPDLVGHLGKLLQIYREAPADQREQALLEAMRQIKGQAKAGGSAVAAATAAMAAAAAAPAPQPPPFQPDIFTPTWGQDRRKYPRIKCCVAVEVQVAGSAVPVWGTLCNTSMGGGFLETATPVCAGSEVKLGLWVSSGKIWVKGMVLNGVVTQSTPAFGMRIKFGQLEPAERDALREFLKYVQSATREHDARNGYLARLKR